jgi:LysW-gamma-L-lysine carboxypeptidase
VRFWQDVLEWAEQINEGKTGYFARVMPHLLSIESETDGFFETVRLSISLRLPPGWTPHDAQAAVSDLKPTDACVEFSSGELAYLSDRHNPLVRGMLAAIRAQKLIPEFVLKTGTSDMNVVGAVWQCPMIAYGPGDSNLDHSPNEHISLNEYKQAIDVLTIFIESL